MLVKTKSPPARAAKIVRKTQSGLECGQMSFVIGWLISVIGKDIYSLEVNAMIDELIPFKRNTAHVRRKNQLGTTEETAQRVHHSELPK